MNQDTRKILLQAATSVRMWAEALAKGTQGEKDLAGYCAIASAELFKQIVGLGLKPELHAWVCEEDGESAHVFVVVDDHVVDVTATQFSKMPKEKVFIRHTREAEYWPWYHAQHQFKTVAALLRWQRKTAWPEGQQVIL